MTGSKAATYGKVANAVFQLEERHGHLKWKVTELVRKAKLSRTWIYEYMGSSKKEILLAALRHFLNEFYGLESAIKIADARERMIQYPEAILFYQKWRARESWLQPEFIAIELKFQAHLKKALPKLSEKQILALHAAIHGLVTAPFLTAKQAQEIYGELWKGWGLTGRG